MKSRFFAFVAMALAVLCGMPTCAEAQGSAGNTLRFGTSTSGTVSGFGNLAPTNEVTIEFWLAPETNIFQYLISQSSDRLTNRLAISANPATRQMTWDFGNVTNGGRLDYTAPGDFSNGWNHFAFVASQSENAMRIYRNGVMETNKAGMSVFDRFSFSLMLGSLANLTNFYRGSIDELRIWRVARTSFQISNYMNRAHLTSTTPGLLAYYKFDESSGAIFNDSSTNNLDGSRGVANFSGSGARLDVPDITTLSASNISFSSVTLAGTATTEWWDATVRFQWGPPGALTNSTFGIFLPASNTASNFSLTLMGVPSGVYQYRAILTNAIDSFQGSTFTFQTRSLTNSGLTFPNITSGCGIWGDYDHDGFMDFLLLGGSTTMISTGVVYLLHNSGDGTFTTNSASTNLAGLMDATAAWGDFDKDGDLDLVMAGTGPASTRLTRLYRNDEGVFTNMTTLLPDVSAGAVAWGDYDNDGDLDILITGTTSGAPGGSITQIHVNENGVFNKIGVNLTGVNQSSASWADYNVDGYLDVLVTGQSATGATNAILYRNYGQGNFTNEINLVTRTVRGSAAWGHYNMNTEPDVLITGVSNTVSGARYTGVHLDGTSALPLTALPQLTDGDGAWGDFNNDGTMDVVVTGNSSTGAVTRVYRPDYTGSYFVDTGDALQSAFQSSVAWADYDEDGDLDLLLTGAISGLPGAGITRLYDNLTDRSNAPPSAPLNLQHYQHDIYNITNGKGAVLVWVRGTDAETTNKIWLTHNVRVGINTGGAQIVRPHSDLTTGKLLIPAMGNVAGPTRLILTNLNPVQTYYWSVQAVDTSFTGGPWAAEKAFHHLTIGVPVVPSVDRNSASIECTANSFGAQAWGWFEWGLASLTNRSSVEFLGNSTSTVPFSAIMDLSAMPSNSTVYFQAVVSNEFGNVLISEFGSLVVPNFELSLEGITNGLAVGQFNSMLVSLTNLYGTNVTFSYSFVGGTPSWVGVNGSVVAQPGLGVGVALVFNAANLTNGIYRTTLIIDAGPTTPDARIPIELHVGPEYFLKPGDLNRDGIVDLLELNTVIQYYRGLLP